MLHKHMNRSAQLPSAVPQEPTKAELIAYDTNPDNVPARAADIILQAYPKAPLIEAKVLLSGAKPAVTAWEEVRHQLCNTYSTLTLPLMLCAHYGIVSLAYVGRTWCKRVSP